MNLNNILFIIRKNVFHQKINCIISILLMAVIFIVVLIGIGMINFFNQYSKSTNNFNIRMRTNFVFTNDNFEENDLINLFMQYDFVDMVINQNEYSTSMIYMNSEGAYSICAKACTFGTMPKVTKGRGLDFNKTNEIILPENMEIYDESNGKNHVINSVELIGTEIQCTTSSYNYTTYYDEVKNALISGGKANGNIGISFKVVGTYDSDLYFEDPFVGYISCDSAKILHASDVKDTSGYTEQTMWVLSDSIENNSKIQNIAVKNNIDYSLMYQQTNRVTGYKIICYIVIFIIILMGVAIASFSAKMDEKKNMPDYTMLKAYGYKEKYLISVIFGKYFLMYFISFLLSILPTIYISGKINKFFGSIDNIGYSCVQISFLSVFIGSLLCIFISLYAVGKLYISFSECTIKDICKDI